MACLYVNYSANEMIAKLRHDNHSYASFRSHQTQSFHSILPALPRPAMAQDLCMDRSSHLCSLLCRCLNHSICIGESVAGRELYRVPSVMALPQVCRLLHPDRRHWHASRLVPTHPSHPGCFGPTDVHCEEAGCTDRIHDWRPVSFKAQSKQKTLWRRLTFYHI